MSVAWSTYVAQSPARPWDSTQRGKDTRKATAAGSEDNGPPDQLLRSPADDFPDQDAQYAAEVGTYGWKPELKVVVMECVKEENKRFYLPAGHRRSIISSGLRVEPLE